MYAPRDNFIWLVLYRNSPLQSVTLKIYFNSFPYSVCTTLHYRALHSSVPPTVRLLEISVMASQCPKQQQQKLPFVMHEWNAIVYHMFPPSGYWSGAMLLRLTIVCLILPCCIHPTFPVSAATSRASRSSVGKRILQFKACSNFSV